MKTIFYKAESRGYANHGWLETWHSFSFANYYNPDRVQFGMLRVLNDDRIDGGEGFGLHPHKNMEIVTIPLEGAVKHTDSMGHEELIQVGEVQRMSAGTGVFHSEYNGFADKVLSLFQIWVLPEKQNIEPSYEQKAFSADEQKNKFQIIVSPSGEANSLVIHQHAWFSLIDMDESTTQRYQLHHADNGVFMLLIDGQVEIENEQLKKRDAIGVWQSQYVDIKSVEFSKLLIIEVPLK